MKQEEWRIVPMTAEHVPQVAAYEKEIFSEPWSEESLFQAVYEDAYCYLVCVKEQQVAGYAGLLCSLDEGQITNIAVGKRYRGQGFGALLVRALCAQAKERGITKLFLEVRAGNETARRLYEKNGFLAVGRRPGFYRKPAEDAIVMFCPVL